jgi:pSer/pThr/pTyr-binding forkhead associated (FHA) protein
MSDTLIRLLTVCLLALVYLFFFRVLRAVWVEVKPVRSARSRQRPRAKPTPAEGQPSRLMILVPDEHRGRQYPLADELTVGRAAGCGVCVDDTYASQVHARIFRRDRQLLIEDLGSTNGTYLNRHRVTGPTPMTSGDQVQVGSTVFEVQP